MGAWRRQLIASALALLVAPAGARAAADAPHDLTGYGIEDLMRLEVSTVARHQEPVSGTATAVTVIDAETIRRSGATCVAEALRLVPGMNVSRLSANMWSISARGFATRLANKMLVLVDGRSVYTPTFSGTYWDAQDILLEDIERIEVIRGPGATAWGANAVNGVIDIITRDAAATHGVLATVGGGTHERGVAALRWGGAPRPDWDARVYAHVADRAAFDGASGGRAADDWRVWSGGARAEWTPRPGRTLTLIGDLRRGDAGGTEAFASLVPPYSQLADYRTGIGNGDVLARWGQDLGGSDLHVQSYLDHESRSDRIYHEDIHTYDLDAQWHGVRGRHELVTGLGGRWIDDEGRNTADVRFTPERSDGWTTNAFAQDEITLVPASLRGTLGAKLEHRRATGFELQPDARLVWTPGPRTALWGAVSRALRTPSRVELAIDRVWEVQPGAPPTALVIVGRPDVRSERLTAYELGARFMPGPRLSAELAGYHDVYTRVRSWTLGDPILIPGPPAWVELPAFTYNDIHGHVDGVELSGAWAPLPRYRMRGGASWAEMHLTADVPQMGPDATDGVSGSLPRWSGFALVSADLPRAFEADLFADAVDRLPFQHVPAYLRVDARLGWRPRAGWELVLSGQNLLHRTHRESDLPEDIVVSSSVPRSFGIRITRRTF